MGPVRFDPAVQSPQAKSLITELHPNLILFSNSLSNDDCCYVKIIYGFCSIFNFPVILQLNTDEVLIEIDQFCILPFVVTSREKMVNNT